MKKLFCKNGPAILGGSGIIFAIFIFSIDKCLPGRFKNLSLFINAALFSVSGVILGKVIQKIYKYSLTDSLTGVKNRGHFYVRLKYEMKKVNKKGSYLSLLMIDIDNFKTVNDRYGHVIGDRVLKQMTNIFRKIIGKNELICRWGGEEFAIILPEIREDGAYKIAEIIRKEIEECSFCSPLTEGNVTISIGAATISRAVDEDTLVKIADKALYKAKEKKNIVVCSTEDTSCQECNVINL